MPATARHAHTIDPVYATPVLRPSSPTDSINTDYGPDETSISDGGVTDDEFAFQIEEALGLRRRTWADADPPKPILLPKPRDAAEEQMMFDHVMRNLREKVKELEEDDFFETILQQNSGPSLAQVPSSSDLQALMRTMMPSGAKNNNENRNANEDVVMRSQYEWNSDSDGRNVRKQEQKGRANVNGR